MIRFIKPYFIFPDERGLITGLIQDGNWREINLVTSKNGTRRGDHFHRETTELFIILSGKIRLHLQREDEKDRIATYIVKGGDVFIIEPMVWHTFEVIEDSSWLNVLNKIIKNDLYKVE